MNTTNPNDHFVTCTTLPDVPSAQVVRSALEDHGIPCIIPDEHTASVASHLTVAIGGVRLQVPESRLQDATELVNELFGGVEEEQYSEPKTTEELGEEEAERAVKTLAVSLLVPPMFFYALWVGLRARGMLPKSSTARSKANAAIFIGGLFSLLQTLAIVAALMVDF